jgi:hypothetical protein
MDFNFFDWIREGVRRSVLLGVSDAVEQMGTPHDEDEVAQRLLSHFPQGPPNHSRIQSSQGSTSAKRLGRSLKSVQDAEKKAA